MSVPEPWEALLLALGTYRLARLCAFDDLTTLPRRWITGMGDNQHHMIAGVVDAVQNAGLDPWNQGDMETAWELARQETPELPHDPVPIPVGPARFYLSRMLRCAWCVGFHVSLLASVAWYASPHWTLIVALPFALSTVIGWSARWLEP